MLLSSSAEFLGRNFIGSNNSDYYGSPPFKYFWNYLEFCHSNDRDIHEDFLLTNFHLSPLIPLSFIKEI